MKKILFVCVENSCRSQMAEGWAKILGSDVADAYSAGSRPSGMINPDAIAVMDESGIDITAHTSKSLNDLTVMRWDYVITMGCGDACPFVQTNARCDWKIEDPNGKSINFFRQVRDDIKIRITHLINEIRITSRNTGD